MNITETGFCIVCGQNSTFRFDPAKISAQLKQVWGLSERLAEAFNRRESMYCSNCGSSLRIRRLCSALIQTFSEINGKTYKSFVELLSEEEFRSMRIAEINSCGSLHNYLKQHPNLYYSEYIPGVPGGSERDGVRCEDLQQLTYLDDYFDIVLTSDTLEHVPDPEKAFNEIYRVLKPGGFHLFTIPVIPFRGATIRRARLVNGERQFLLAPAYHGPWERQDVLVFTDFGMDIVHKLKLVGFATDVLFLNRDNELDTAFVFRSRKPKDIPPATRIGEYPMLEWTGERFLPWIQGAQAHYEHLHRYAFAAHFVRGKKVLDLACGEGYGANMLAKEADYVAGVEIDEPTVEHARSRYTKDNLEFMEGSILEVPIEGEKMFDVAVCFEAIEHIAEHDKLLSEVKRLLKDDGLFIVSTPNKAVYTDARDHHSQFHMKELYSNEFQNLLSRYFIHIRIFGQRTYAGSNMWSISERRSRGYMEEVIKKDDMEFYFAERTGKEPFFFVALATDRSLRMLAPITDSWLTDASDTLINDYQRALTDLRIRVARISSLETGLELRVGQVRRLQSQIHRLESQIYQIQHSIPMRLAGRYQRRVERLLPPSTRRRRGYELMLSGIRVILTEGWRSFWARFKGWLLRRPRHTLKLPGRQGSGQFGQADSMSPKPELTQEPVILPEKSSGSPPPDKPALTLTYNPMLQSKTQFLMYDVSNEILRRNWEVIEGFRQDPHLELNRALWILPSFDHIYRGGIYTIFRVADSFSRQFGTFNLIAFHGGANVALPEMQTMIRKAFPSLKFELTVLRDLREADDLPPCDAAFCTLWTTAYILVRYNKCRAKFYFVQDFEPAFSAAGSTYGLIEQTYRFGFVGVANTPGVGELYRQYNPWVQYFIPGVDKSIFYPEPERSVDKRIQRIVFYGRPRNNRNAFELGAAALSLVKNQLGDAVEIASVGADFTESKYDVKGIMKNRGVLRSLEEIAALYRSSYVGLVFMYTAHPSYQPFEFMASGCVTVSNFNRYTQWFLRDGENAALTHSTPTCIAERILEVLQDEELRHRIVDGGLKTVSTLEWDAALERITKFVCDPSPSQSQFLSGDIYFYDTTE